MGSVLPSCRARGIEPVDVSEFEGLESECLTMTLRIWRKHRHLWQAGREPACWPDIQ